MRRTAVFIPLAASLAACASTELPQAQLADTQSAISAAREAGARQDPQASYHLELARKQLTSARQAADEGEEEEARRSLVRAEMDATLARQKAREQKARRAAEQVMQRVQKLRRELDSDERRASS